MSRSRGLAGAFAVFLIFIFVSVVSIAHEKTDSSTCEKFKPAVRPDLNQLVLVNFDETEIIKDSGMFIAAKAWRLPGEVPEWVEKGDLRIPGELYAVFLTTLHIGDKVFLYRWTLKLEDETECVYAAFSDGKIYTEIGYPKIEPSSSSIAVLLLVLEDGVETKVFRTFPVPRR